MSQQSIDIGVQGNDGTGDSIRESFRKVNENFNEIYAVFGLGGTINFTNLSDAPNSYTANQIITANNLGTLLVARDLVAGNGIDIDTSSDSSITINATIQGLNSDTAGTGLAQHLNANTLTIGRLAEPTEATLDLYNQAYTGLGAVQSTLGQLVMTRGYADSNYVKSTNGVVTDAFKTRPEPVVPDTADPDYDPTLTSNYLSTEAMQRKDVVYRGGDTMTGKLKLSDHPVPMAGAGTPNTGDDLQAATKYYVDNSTYSSNVNLYVSTTSGDDSQVKSPIGKEGRSWRYSYKTLGAAALAAENLINLAGITPGPYKQRIAYTVGPDQEFSTIQGAPVLSGGNIGTIGYQDAADLLTANKTFIQAETIAYINKKYVNNTTINDADYSELIGNIIDGVCYDIVIGTDFNSITQASNLLGARYADLSQNQLSQLLDVITFLKNQISSYNYDIPATQNYIVAVLNALTYDLVFEGKFQSLEIGRAFPTYATNLSKTEITETLLNLRDTLLADPSVIISPNAVASITDNITNINDTIINESFIVDADTYPPISSTPNGIINAKILLLENIDFIQAEILAYLRANWPNVEFDRDSFNQDVANIIWSLIYDFTYDGNSQSVYAGLGYWVNSTLRIQTYQVDATVDAIDYLDALCTAIINNDAPALVYQTSFRQYTNETLTNGGLAGTSISANITTIKNIVDSTTEPTPVIVNPDVTDGPVVLQTARSTLLSQVTDYEDGAIDFINTNPAFDVITDSLVVTLANDYLDSITSLLTFGLDSRVEPTFTNPPSITLPYVHARTALLTNLDFIAAEALAYAATQPAWNALTMPGDGDDSFKQRMKYLIEAICYDISYGGDTASANAGKQYWLRTGASTLSTAERTVTQAVITRLANIAPLIAANTLITKTPANPETQNTSGPTDGDEAAQDIADLFNLIIDIYANNTSYTAVAPDLTDYDADLKAGRTIILSNKSIIIADTISYIKEAYIGGFNYVEATCYRDIGYIIDGMIIDILTGGNYQTVTAGKSYYKNASAKAVAIGSQLTETLDGINFAKNLGLQCLNQTTATRYQLLVTQYKNPLLTASPAAITTFSANMNTIVSIIINGVAAAPAASFGTGIWTIRIDNGGNGFVDQGLPGAVHIIPGKVLVGANSSANALIVKYIPNSGPGFDSLQVRLVQPGFFVDGEELDFAETVQNLNVTIFMESGIYLEDYPIRLPAQCSIKGDEFRRTIIRPLDRISQSPWRKIFFYRDAVIDALEIGIIDTSTDLAPATTLNISGTTNIIVATLGAGQAPSSWIGLVIQDDAGGKAVIDSVSGNILNCSVIYPFNDAITYPIGDWHLYETIDYGRHYLTDPLDITSTAKNNKDIDVLLCNDATRVTDITFQGHGGFAMVLDPEGQIKTKSPYGQVCTSFSASINRKRFAGGQFVDGFAGRLFGNVTNVADSGITVTVTGSVNSGLDVRPPQVPCVFYVQGNRFQVNDIVSYNPSTYTVVLTLDVGTPLNPNELYNAVDFAEEVGNIVDGTTYDLVLGSNYQSIVTGLRDIQPANTLVGIEKLFRLSGIEDTKLEMLSRISNVGSEEIIFNNVQIIKDIVTNGLVAVPATIYTNPVGASTNNIAAKNILQANRSFIASEIVAWIANNYSVRAITDYNAVVVSRDFAYYVDALTYDVLYNGNSASWNIAQLFYDKTAIQITEQRPYYASALGYFASIISNIVQNITVPVSAGNLLAQNVSLPTSNFIVAGTLKNLISVITDYVLDGSISNAVQCSTAATSTTITNVTYSTRLVPGATITGVGIPTSTTIISYNEAARTAVISNAATLTASQISVIIGGLLPTKIDPSIPIDASYNQVNADRTTLVNAKVSIQTAVINYLDAGAGLGINIEMGGNRSMLANDFAMINDLGYAIFATNGGVTEQVSTFSYYCHTHYWANNGGQIRSVGGSNAHGTYGLRASGYDVTELPDAVSLANDMVQTARIYKQGQTVNFMAPTVTSQALSLWILGYDYNPPNNSELEIDHSVSGGGIVRYLVSTVEHTTITINGQNVLRVNLSTAGTNSTLTTGLQYPLYDGQLVTLRVNQNIKFFDIDNVRPTRPSTAVQYSENLSSIYRVIAYSLVESTGEALPSNVAVLQSDAGFDYYKFTTDLANIATADPDDPTKTQGSSVGDNKIAVLQISNPQVIDQINKGIYLTGYAGRVHRIISYTVPEFIATGIVDSYTSVSSVHTLILTSVGGDINIGDTVAGTGFLGYTGTVTNVVLSGTTSITATVTLSNAATSTPSGTITFGVESNGYLTIDPNSVRNNSADGTGVSAMTYKSHAAGPSGTTYTAVKFSIPFADLLPSIDSYLTVAGNSNSNYNGSYQVLDVTNNTRITVASTTDLSIGMIVSSSSIGAYVPANCIIQSVDSETTFTVSPAAWVPPGSSVTAILVAYLSGVTILNGGSGYNAATPPTITLTGGGVDAVQGIAVAVINSAGNITDINIVSPGYGYTSTPTVTVTGNASLQAVLSESPEETVTTTGGSTTVDLTLAYPSSPLITGTATATTHGVAITSGSSIAGTTLTIGTVSSGTIAAGMYLTGGTIPVGTYITANIAGTGDGSTWTINKSVTQSSTAITGTNNLITVNSVANLDIGMPIALSDAASLSGIGEDTYYITEIIGSTQIAVSETYNGINVGVTNSSGAGVWTASAFQLGTPIIITGYTSKTGSIPGPYEVTLTIAASAITNGAYYRVTGNTNELYNGYWQCTSATNASATSITLSYTYDPGIWSTATVTTVAEEVTRGTSSQLGIAQPFNDSTATTLRLGYPAGTGGQITQRISTCRVTGHDLLDIGTGSYTTTNWPTVIYGNPAIPAQQSQEILEEGVGRVFYVTTDQNGIFRVGRFFTVDQGTGSVTFSASIALSNLDGLGFKRGVVVSEFSTDPSLTNNATDTVPVQSAIRSYIDKRLGLDHGGSPLALSNLIGPGYLALNGTLAMKGPINLAGYTVTNVGNPAAANDAVSLSYLNATLSDYGTLAQMDDVSIATPATNNLLVYNSVTGKWVNKTITGDVTISYNTGSGAVTSIISAGAIDNAKVSTTAAIAQSKLSMTIAGTSATSPTGTAAVIQAASGLASFNSTTFTVTNGWVELRTATSGSTGVLLTKVQHISAGSILGNLTASAAAPAEVSPASVVSSAGGLTNSLFANSGVLTVSYDGLSTNNNSYSVTATTTARAANALVRTGASGEVDMAWLKVGGYKIAGLGGVGNLTSVFTTPGGFDYFNVVGTTSSNTTVTAFGTLDVSNGTLKTNLLTTDKTGATSGAAAGSASISGWWAVQASSQIDFSLGKLVSLSLDAGAEDNRGNIRGIWSLTGASKLQATYADLAEYYEGDQEYEPGTVLVFGGDKEVTTSTTINDTRAAGVVTTNPAYVMNQEQTGIKVCIALAGRVPCKVIGRIKKGDMLTTSATPGYAIKAHNPTLGSIIGKALEDKDNGDAGVIQVAVGRV
jgi:hypothetical protein